MATKTRAQGFDPTRGLTWTAETNVESIKNLVRDRETLFAKHRKFDKDSLQRPSQQTLQKSLNKDAVYQTYYDRYIEFCTAVNIPCFPISLSTITLFLYAKCSYQNGNFASAIAYLKRARTETIILWENIQGVDDLEDSAAIAIALQQFRKERKGLRLKTKRSSSKRNSAQTDSSDLSDASDDSDDPTVVHQSRLQTVPQLVVPNLPQPGDRFSTANDLLVACYLALLPVYGNGAAISASVRTAIVVDCLRSRIRSSDPSGGGCKWRIGAVQDSKTKEIIVSSDKSHLLHNHGPAEALKEDSTWRPPVQNPLVQSALGLPPLEPRSRIQVSKRSQTPSKPDEQSSKKLNYTPYQFDSSQISEYSPYSSMLTHSSTNVQSNSQVSNSSHFAHYPQLASSSTTSFAPPYPAHGFSMPQSHSSSTIPAVIASTSLAQTPTPERSPFFPKLERFLRALHPSLSALAIHLFDAGIDSFELLCLFNAFESETLARFLQLVKSQDVKQEISNVHLRLLQKKLDEAKVGEWND
ncbi:hypothetical protein JCM5353_007893 [Sporobolomyces roseus]